MAMVTEYKAISSRTGRTLSPMGYAVGGGVQGAGQVASDGSQAVVYFTDLGAHLH
jgi:hypothetical protein